LSKQSAIQIDRSERLLHASLELLVAVNATSELEKMIARGPKSENRPLTWTPRG
jgi:hypothetical protein